jgi:alpha,alpha-trehalase
MNKATTDAQKAAANARMGALWAPDTYAGGSPYPPIAEYAFLSDCQHNALVAPDGNVEWLCLPRPDSGSVFAAMLDRTAGGFRIGPADFMVPGGRRYLPGTNVLETTWMTTTGWLNVRDGLLIGPWYHRHKRSATHRRPPRDHEAECCLVRTVKCLSGSVELSLDCQPALEYGRARTRWEYVGDGYGQARATADDVEVELLLTTDLRLGFEQDRAIARTTLTEGDVCYAALSWLPECTPPATYDEANDRMWRTGEFWRQWIGHGDFPDHPWRIFLQRSALTLKGLTYVPTGAMLAAATTSLPETPQGERNWDYRYTWLRDATFTLWGLYTLGFDAEANDFFNFVADVVEETERYQIMYGIGGEHRLAEETLDHLHGYEGARPVRAGNAAYDQDQHDVWGALLDSVYLHTKSQDYLSERTWKLLSRAVEAAIEHWAQPDRGIWEVRGDPKHFVSSKAMCWVALDRGSRLAAIQGDGDCAGHWAEIASDIRADVLAHGVDDRGVFTQHYDTDALDAANLLLPLVRFLPADDERIRNTVLAIADELTVDGLVLRYRVDATDDGLQGEEGTFTICSFWLVSALVEIGEVDRARTLCEKLLSYASPLLLYAEELDPKAGRHLGNFPQAFTHLALINAVTHVVRADQRQHRGFLPARGV